MTNDVIDSQYDIPLKHFTGYFVLIDKNIIWGRFYVHDVASKIKLNQVFQGFTKVQAEFR